MALLIALSAGWCAGGVGGAQALQDRGAGTRVAGPIAAAGVARASATCPQVNSWLGLPYLNRYADGKCGYMILGTTLPIPDRLAAFPTQPTTLYQEGGVKIESKAVFTLSSGSTLIIADPHRKDPSDLDLAVYGTLVVQPGAALRLAGGSIRVYPAGASLQMRGTQARPITVTSAQSSPAPGDWGRIEFDPGTTGTLSYVQSLRCGRDPAGHQQRHVHLQHRCRDQWRGGHYRPLDH